ncbi:MAG: guanylate kinase [Desulfobacteraceae bacterium]|nr:MAG: guanylate kinase [Desulfobacteraceae bacterium]
MSGQLFVISAPSGAGKSTILKALKGRIEGIGYSISHTTRRPRGTEKDGTDYHFVERETFSRMIDGGDFVEWAQVYDDLYGTSSSSLNEQTATGLDVLLDVDSQGARNIKKNFRTSVLIYVLPPSLEALRKRLMARGTDGESVIRARMEKVPHEIKQCLWYDYIIINDDLEKAIEEAQAIILSTRCRTARQTPIVKKLFYI